MSPCSHDEVQNIIAIPWARIRGVRYDTSAKGEYSRVGLPRR